MEPQPHRFQVAPATPYLDLVCYASHQVGDHGQPQALNCALQTGDLMLQPDKRHEAMLLHERLQVGVASTSFRSARTPGGDLRLRQRKARQLQQFAWHCSMAMQQYAQRRTEWAGTNTKCSIHALCRASVRSVFVPALTLYKARAW